MQRIETIAIAAKNEGAFGAFLTSLSNLSAFAIDFMYGTKERARITCLFAYALLILGMVITSNAANGPAVCPV